MIAALYGASLELANVQMMIKTTLVKQLLVCALFNDFTIIDHNDGYMSLYGHNQAQYKQAGDWVEAGEVIATVGDSGGQENTGLYFEIRYQGKPVNPAQWCSSSVRHVALQEP